MYKWSGYNIAQRCLWCLNDSAQMYEWCCYGEVDAVGMLLLRCIDGAGIMLSGDVNAVASLRYVHDVGIILLRCMNGMTIMVFRDVDGDELTSLRSINDVA